MMNVKEYYSPDRFKDKVMVITGAASGIGRAVALRAAKEGASLVLVDMNQGLGEQVLALVKKDSENSIFLQADLSDSQKTEKIFQIIINHFGHIDVAINNVGTMGTPNPVHLLTDEQINQSIGINLISMFYCAREEIKCFLEKGNGGAIVNNASMAGIVGMPSSPAYTAAKHGVNGLTKNMALDYARFGIRVNSVNPGPTKTAMTEAASRFSAEMAEDNNAKWDFSREKAENVQHRKAEAEEQAASILFLASEEATHITGAVIATDGGWTAF